MIKDRGEETIHEMNETPSDVECNGHQKKNDAANSIRFFMEHIYPKDSQPTVTYFIIYLRIPSIRMVCKSHNLQQPIRIRQIIKT
jgi:hypothetical protein